MTHEYPPNRTFDSVSVSRVAALAQYGLTLRQRQFLVTVMVHSGCFLERQYCEFTGTARGQNSREFVARLVDRGFARAIEPGPVRRGRLYHVHHKPLYEAIGLADNRNRRLRTIGRMVERVMVLDAVLGDRRCWWLSPECDKRAFFDLTQQTGLRPEDYPHIAFGAGRTNMIRCFPDKLPIGIQKDDTSRFVFLYLVNRQLPVDFRQFLIRHAELFRFLHEWRVRLLLPRRFRKAQALYKAALREELWTPVNPSVSKSLETYFGERQEQGGHLGDPSDRYIAQEFRKQGMPKIQALYRAWRRSGDRVLWQSCSTCLRDDRAYGRSEVEVQLLNRQYLQLTGSMDRDVWAKRGAKRKSRQVGPPLFDRLYGDSLTSGRSMTANRVQASQSQQLAASASARRRFVPPSLLEPVPQSLNQRWRERPRCPARPVTQAVETGSFTPSLVVADVAVRVHMSCRTNAPPACSCSCPDPPECSGR